MIILSQCQNTTYVELQAIIRIPKNYGLILQILVAATSYLLVHTTVHHLQSSQPILWVQEGFIILKMEAEICMEIQDVIQLWIIHYFNQNKISIKRCQGACPQLEWNLTKVCQTHHFISNLLLQHHDEVRSVVRHLGLPPAD